jgi:hypothetical protein
VLHGVATDPYPSALLGKYYQWQDRYGVFFAVIMQI